MEKLGIYGAAAAFIVIAFIAGFMIGGSGAKSSVSPTSASTTVVQQGQTNSSQVLFSSQQYSNYAYPIAPGNVSQQSKAALDGYSMSVVPLSSGSENVTIGVDGTNRARTITLASGDKLYVVETTFGDDGPGYDGSFGDDGFVIVSQGGYVVNTFVV